MEYMVRDGQQVVPACPECGCRLQQLDWIEYWIHYRGEFPLDAQGHDCKYFFVTWVPVKGQLLGYHTSSLSPYHDIPLVPNNKY